VSDTLAVPYTAEDLQEVLTTPSKIKALSEDPKKFQAFMNAYTKEFGVRDKGESDEQIRGQVEDVFANYLRDRGAEARVGGEKGRKVSAAEMRAQGQSATYKSGSLGAGAKLDGQFADLWEYLEVVNPKNRIGGKNADKLTLIENAMSSTDPASGGFLIPDEFRAQLMQVSLEKAVVRSRATVLPMTSLRISIPFVDSTSNVSSVYGGIIGYWAEEGAALTQSQPQFGRIALEAKKLTTYTEVPNELRRDSAISVEILLNRMFPEGITWFEDIAFMFGSGAGEPLGIFDPTNGALITQAAEAGQDGVATPSGASVLWENIVKMYSRMIPSSLASAVWVISPAVLPQLFTMALSVGTGGSVLGPIVSTNGTGAPVMSLLGIPIIISEKVSNLGTQGDVNLIDFSQYLIGDRMQMEAEVSTEYKFGNDVVAYRFIERVDGRPWLQSPITPRNGGPALSAYVSLAARP
jgi:HK97 family phage major capsid protein